MEALLRESGQTEAVEFQTRLRMPVWSGGTARLLRSSRLPGPLHLLPALVAYRHLTLADRGRTLRASAGLSLTDRDLPKDETWAAWLARSGATAASRQRLWELFTLAVENARAEDIPASDALRDIRMALLSGPGAARIGRFVRPLGEVAERIAGTLRDAGGKIRYRSRVRRILSDPGQVGRAGSSAGAIGVELQDGTRLQADAVVMAVPPWSLRPLVEGGADLFPAPMASSLARILPSAIVNVYLGYDRPVLAEPFAAVADPPMPVLFRCRPLGTERADGAPAGGPRAWVSMSVSAAGSLLGESDAALVSMADRITREVATGPWGEPEHDRAVLLTGRVVWQHRATALPRTLGPRPSPRNPVAGRLWLSGDWTDTGWPQTLESAVRSGEAVSEAILASWGSASERSRAKGASDEEDPAGEKTQAPEGRDRAQDPDAPQAQAIEAPGEEEGPEEKEPPSPDCDAAQSGRGEC